MSAYGNQVYISHILLHSVHGDDGDIRQILICDFCDGLSKVASAVSVETGQVYWEGFFVKNQQIELNFVICCVCCEPK